ncbi:MULTISPECIES: DUF4124 domain-containing protein [unclassified Oleiphilus]|uniref:DUF4124 domain-containing protein n=1 Tax=unclassified Oleiphilus TaxID=2631174 RepID=UPI0007C20C30|nr:MULTISPECIES: DUF4124 domain-containing protein [unclassified Oleiphilus]KZY61541.1 hypothetical protein A3738_13705 [Oleiphilus sp. HI0066]KZY68718.1 hypothetical protein A3739_10500 [Oleiphilus sp. HI0067]KZZ61461.1 hypothetical protein A3762_14275 [Oleiphilus sp. HI0125]MCH2159987.1 DUF4124 domain-containing protein [Oleiphilaceae bacterium]
MDKHRNKKRLLFIALLCSLSTLAYGQIYKWTDEQGRVHYSDKKPESNKQVSEVKVQTGKGLPAPNKSNSPAPNTPEKEQALQEKAAQLSQTTDKKAPRDDNKCAAVKENLSRMVDGARLRIKENGQMRYMTPEEIADKRALSQTYLAENC